MTNVLFDGIPLGEVAKQLKTSFSNQFDVIITPSLSPVTGPGIAANPAAEPLEPSAILINLRLKNVTAGEIFNAMNLYFEAQNIPVRWELKMNGHRPIAVVRLAEEPAPDNALARPYAAERIVIYVGDLLGEGLTMDNLVEKLREIYTMASVPTHPALPRTPTMVPHIAGHKETSLLIVSGTPEQIGIIRSTIDALKQKVEADRHKAAAKAGPESPGVPHQPAPGTP
jgi:hypothetical protein